VADLQGKTWKRWVVFSPDGEPLFHTISGTSFSAQKHCPPKRVERGYSVRTIEVRETNE